MTLDSDERLLAEQVAVDCALADVEDILEGLARPHVSAVLHLAGDAGEAAGLLVLGDRPLPAADRVNALSASVASQRAGSSVCLPFQWRTRGYAVLFPVLTGHLDARLAADGVVISIEGLYAVAVELAGRPLGRAAGRRAAEVAVRTWLNQLRTALEIPTNAKEPPGSPAARVPITPN